MRTSLLLILFFFTIYCGLCQITSTDKINTIVDTTQHPAKVTFEFTTGKQLAIKQGYTCSVSPNERLLGIMKFNSGIVTVINYFGDTVNEIEVVKLSRISIANNGNIAIYGYAWTQHISTRSALFFYENDGSEIQIKNQYFGINPLIFFTSENGCIYIGGVDEYGLLSPKEYEVLFFDNRFKVIEHYYFERNQDVKRIIISPKVDIKSKTLIVYKTSYYLYNNYNIRNYLVHVENYKFDFKGNIINE